MVAFTDGKMPGMQRWSDLSGVPRVLKEVSILYVQDG